MSQNFDIVPYSLSHINHNACMFLVLSPCMRWVPHLLRSMSEEDEDVEVGALGLLLLLWECGVVRGSPASQLSADERDPDRSSEDLQEIDATELVTAAENGTLQ